MMCKADTHLWIVSAFIIKLHYSHRLFQCFRRRRCRVKLCSPGIIADSVTTSLQTPKKPSPLKKQTSVTVTIFYESRYSNNCLFYLVFINKMSYLGR